MRNDMKIKRLHLLAPLLALTLCMTVCSSDHGEETPSQAVAPAAPSGLVLFESAETSLTLQWDRVDGADTYAWTLLEGGTQVRGGETAARNVKISDLNPGTAYVFGLRAVGAGGTSAESRLEVSTKGNAGPAPADDSVYALFKIPASEEDGVARAFPGAEGAGMYTTGGRGGAVYHVTKLDDSGEGTLRWALGKTGARTIVFDVAGIIALESPLDIKNGDVTVAGQTAPGDGICIKNFTVRVNTGGDKAASGKDGNVILRFLRFRMGDEKKTEDDAFWGRRNRNVIIDHCSVSWSTDECSSWYGNECFTMQWCILSESLTHSVHGKGSHGYGGIWGGKDASFHHNLLAHHDNRTPRFDHPGVYENPSDPAMRGNVDHRNNVVYNWGSGSGCYGGNAGAFNLVGNYYKPGPASRDRAFFIEADAVYKSSNTYTRYEYPSLYLSGNKHTLHDDITRDNAKGVYWKEESGYTGEPVSQEGRILSAPLPLKGRDGKTVYVTTTSADDAFGQVLSWAGASLRRDAVDERAVADARSGKATFEKGSNGSSGGLIDTQSDVGGWPSYEATDAERAAVKDTDGDGMPDAFEDRFGLDKADASDGKAKRLDKFGRYTNLEMYLHYLVRDIVAGQVGKGEYKQL